MNNIPIVDAHHHLWDLENEKTKYSWLMVKEGEAFFGDYGAIRKSYKLEDYLNDANTLVQFGWKSEAIPITRENKSFIARIFEKIFK